MSPIERLLEEIALAGVASGLIVADPPPIVDPVTMTITAILAGSIERVNIDGVINESPDDESCPVRPDQTHCVHWWDAEGLCCGCGAGEETLMIGDQWYWIDRHMDGAEIGPYPDQAQARLALAADERRRALAEALRDCTPGAPCFQTDCGNCRSFPSGTGG